MLVVKVKIHRGRKTTKKCRVEAQQNLSAVYRKRSKAKTNLCRTTVKSKFAPFLKNKNKNRNFN